MPNDLPPRDHNHPPELVGFDELSGRVNGFIDTSNRWIIERPTLTDADMADKASGLKTQLGDLKKDLDKRRREAKKPHEDAASAVDAVFKPMIDLVDRAYRAIGDKITAFMLEQQRKADEERRQKEAEARRQREEAEAAAERAREEASKQGGDALRAQAEAEAKARLAAQAEKDAAKPTKVQLRGDYTTKAVSLRVTWHARVTDETAALRHYAKNKIVRAAALKAALDVAASEAKLAKNKDAAPPGFEFYSESRAA